MSLRAKILLLFGALAIAPILVVGLLDYMHSIRALDQLVRAKVEGSTEQAAREIGERHARALSDAKWLAEQPAIGFYLRTAADGDAASGIPAAASIEQLRAESWSELRERFASIELIDPWGRLVYRFADPDTVRFAGTTCGELPAVSTLSWPVVDGRGRVGEVIAVPRLDALLPHELLAPRFGAGAHSVVVNRETGRIVYAHNCDHVGQRAYEVLPSLGYAADSKWWQTSGGQVTGGDHDELFTTHVAVGTPPWTVARTANLDEFTTPYARLRAGYLVFVLFVALGAAGGFSILLSGVMRSLRQLGSAADRIGGGDFNPWLPPPTSDEVGRLSMAIALMVDKLRQSLRQIEVSRQMAVVGKMAAYLAHEIRNPLSSIRLNLQALVRDTRDGGQPEDLPEILDLCLGEVKRLDAAVHGVLSLGRAQDATKRVVSIREILDDALELLRPQFDEKRVNVVVLDVAGTDRVEASPEQIKGVLLNLLLNAAAAMPTGGRIAVWTEVVAYDDAEPVLAIHVRDEGPGVPEDLRERIFEPFFTTRRSGTGIGLPLSMQTAHEHGGRLYLAETDQSGAEFVLELPLPGADLLAMSDDPDGMAPALRRNGPARAPAAHREAPVAAGAIENGSLTKLRKTR